jgi:very-short-patch-repair endonuclease
MAIVTCHYCQTPIQRKISDITQSASQKFYCDRNCLARDRHPAAIVTCYKCQVQFRVKPQQIKQSVSKVFICSQCNEARTLLTNCHRCNKSLYVKASVFQHSKRKIFYCSMKCRFPVSILVCNACQKPVHKKPGKINSRKSGTFYCNPCKSKLYTVICCICQKPIHKKLSAAVRSISKMYYCSQQCLSIAAERRHTKECLHCGNTFRGSLTTTRFCSAKCVQLYSWKAGRSRRIGAIHAHYKQQKRPVVKKECVVCNTTFDATHKLKQQCCSQKCRGIFMTRSHNIKKCLTCKKTFKTVMGKGKYCSYRCMGDSRELLQIRIDGIKKKAKDLHDILYIQKPCEKCGTPFEVRQSDSARRKYCSTPCKMKASPRASTAIERILEQALIQVKLVPHPQFPWKRYTIDLALPDWRIAVEADGTYWHSLPRSQRNDRRRDKALRKAGWIIFRFTDAAIYADALACATQVLAYIQSQRQLPLLLET